MNLINYFILFIPILVNFVSGQSKLRTVFSWTVLDWEFPNQQLKSIARQNGDYVPENGIPVGIERWNNRLFVSVPRWKDGIPATLNYIDLNETASGLNTPLKPYRGFENNIAGDCENGLSTVYRIKADRCDRLWVLDVGTVGIGDDTRQVCPYAINIFDLRTDTRIRRYEFQDEDTNANTFIANTLIEIGDDCNDAHAYFSDELGYGLIVYSFEENTSWRFEHGFFFPDPLRGDFNIGGLNFQWAEEGIFGMALGPRLVDGSRALFFSPLASHREFYVSTEILKDKNNVEGSYHEFRSLNERAEGGHTTSRVIDEASGIMLFNLIDQNAVGCWNSQTDYNPSNHDVVDRDNVAMIFPADVKVDHDRQVWVISDRMPNFLITTLDPNDINFRIFTAPFDFLVAGTVCAGGAAPRFPNTPTPVVNRIIGTNVGNRFPILGSGIVGSPAPEQISEPKPQPLGVESLINGINFTATDKKENNTDFKPITEANSSEQPEKNTVNVPSTTQEIKTTPTRTSTFRQPSSTKPHRTGGYYGSGLRSMDYHGYGHGHYRHGHDHGADCDDEHENHGYKRFNHGNKRDNHNFRYRSWLW